jgi:histidinol-phosphatase (PHP family)
MITADYHVHTDFSSDSKTPMDQMIQQAIQLGLKKICFTEHMDYDYPPVSDLPFTFDPDAYMKKLDEIKAQYQNRIEILGGVELGLQPHLADRLNALIHSYPFDFIIGSSHVIEHTDPYFPEYWQNRTVREGIQRYFESILENCRVFQGFHVYGHIDYIIRYLPGQLQAAVKTDYSYSDFADLLDEVLKTIISLGKGIEVNTAGLKYGHAYAHPKPEILKRYRELGGELITIGSDAHKPEHLCYDFGKVPDMLKDLGYRYYATFKQGKPVYEKL